MNYGYNPYYYQTHTYWDDQPREEADEDIPVEEE